MQTMNSFARLLPHRKANKGLPVCNGFRGTNFAVESTQPAIPGLTTMKTRANQSGFTLVELMITVGIVGVLSAIALPAYKGYIEITGENATKANAVVLAGFEDAYFYENDSYLAGTYDPPGTDDLTAALNWKPSGDFDKYTYVVAAGSTGNIATSYTITVTYKPNPAITATVSKP
ncbi:MAG: prepilin-type N-terminal cleavage/methylation domain-containing protein [Gammaproteobacteria bacterium]